MTWTSWIPALLISPALLYADAVIGLTFSVQGPGSCGSSLSSTANSETLDAGPCIPAAETNPAAWVSATAQPFYVAVQGSPGYMPASVGTDVAIFASAEWDGGLEVIGGTGSAFLDFRLSVSGAADDFGSFFAIPALDFAVSAPGDPWSQFYSLPVTFGVPYAYTMSVFEGSNLFLPNQEDVSMSVDDITVVDASGIPIPGASDPEVPEPHAIWLLGVAALLALPGLAQRLNSGQHSVYRARPPLSGVFRGKK